MTNKDLLKINDNTYIQPSNVCTVMTRRYFDRVMDCVVVEMTNGSTYEVFESWTLAHTVQTIDRCNYEE